MDAEELPYDLADKDPKKFIDAIVKQDINKYALKS
jgi:hypothetical protein